MGLALICTANGPQCPVAEDTYSPYATDNKGFLSTELEVLTLHVQRALHLVTDAIMASVFVPVLVLELRFVTYERKTNQCQPIVKVD